jgi:hypothetical protein
MYKKLPVLNKTTLLLYKTHIFQVQNRNSRFNRHIHDKTPPNFPFFECGCKGTDFFRAIFIFFAIFIYIFAIK